jgi:outer membrane receptor protein involved in Fe transport
MRVFRLYLCLSAIGATASVMAQSTDAPKVPPYSETVAVTAARAEQPLLDTPVSLTIVGEKQIERSPAENYADLLRGVPGLNVVQTSARDVSIRARGATKVAENSQVALVDGRSVYLDYYGIVVWDYLPIDFDEVKSIEVLRGPGSAVWGANAMSGVINVLTKSPKELAGGSMTLRAGERGTRSASLIWGQSLGRTSYKISGSFLEQDPWPRDNLLPDGTPFPFGYTYKNEGTRQPKLDGRVDTDLDPSSTLSLRAGYGGTTGIFHSSVGPFLIQRGAHVGYGEASWTHGATEVKAYVNQLDGDAPNLLNGLPFSFLMTTYVADGTSRTPIGAHQLLIYGASARANRFNLSIAPGHSSRNDEGVFAEDIVSVTPRLELNAGLRVDHFDLLGTVASPRASIVVQPRPNHAIRLSANRAYRAPTLVENYLDISIPNAVILPPATPFFFYTQAVGNPDLKRESSDALELGYSARLRNFYVDAALYRNTVKNNVTFFPSEFYGPADPPPGWPGAPSTVPVFALPKVFTYFNVGSVRNEGLDASAEFRSGAATLRASYTWQRTPHVVNHDPFIPLVVNRPPKQMASISGELDHDRWFGSASASYSDRAFWADVLDPRFWGYTKAYTIVSGTVGLHAASRSDVSIEGTNLFNQRVKQHVFGDIIGRRITVGVRHHFQ